MNVTKKPTVDEVIASLFDYDPSIEDAIAIHAEASKILYKALDREYRRQRENLDKAGQSSRFAAAFRSLQEDVRSIVSLSSFTEEGKAIIQFAFSKWRMPRDISQVRLPVNQ